MTADSGVNQVDRIDTLLAQLSDGDRSGFAELFGLLWPPLHRFCVSFLNREADAADAAQEAMQKIFERASDYDCTRRAMPWALAIAAWECRTVARRQARRREVDEDHAKDQQAAVDTEGELMRRELATAAVNALGTLSESDRETLMATYWDEAASVSGTRLRKRRERALSRLRQTWRKLYGLD